MAEHVYQNLESMLPELEDLERNGIFERNELRIIIKKRTDMEYKLQRRVVEKQDFLKYLEYELNVDTLRRKRMQKLGLKFKHTAAEIGINKRMHYVFQKALKKFGNDLKLWMQYIDFCKKMGGKASISRALGKLMQIHAQNPSVWIMAAKWEFEENGSIDNARTLMQKSLRLNPASKTLWLEYFRLELLHVDKIKKRKEILSLSTEGDQIESGDIPELFLANKTASIVYNNAIQAFPDDVGFRVEFLSFYRLFPDTKQSQDEVYNGLKREFASNEAANLAVARRPLEDIRAEQANGSKVSEEDWEKAEAACRELFGDGAKRFGTGSWQEAYLQSFLELIKQDDATAEQTTRRLRSILSILSDAEKCGLVTEQMFLAWSELLLNLDDGEGVVEILSKAVDSLSTPALCERYLSIMIQITGPSDATVAMLAKDASGIEGGALGPRDDWDVLNAEFEKCIKKLNPKESFSIWQLWMTACTEGDATDAAQIFEKSLTASKDIAEFGRCRYLKWAYETKGIKDFRKLFKRLKEVCPLTPEFIQFALDCENKQETKCLARIRKLHETAVDSFGKNSTGCWLDFIKFELEQEEAAVDIVGRLYWRALKALDSSIVGDFVDKYTLLSINL